MHKMCQCYVYYSLKYFIKNQMPPPPPPGSLFPYSWLFLILYNNVNKVINVIQITVCNKNKLNEQLVLYVNVHLATGVII